MVSRTDYYAETLTAVTTTSTSWTAHSGLTWTPEASTTYFVFGSGIMDLGSTTEFNASRLHNTTSGVTLFTGAVAEAKDTTDFYSTFGVAVYTSSASPTSTTFQWQMTSEGGSTVGLSKCRVYVLKKHANDAFVTVAAETTTAATSSVTRATLNYTPGSSGDYLEIGYAELSNAAFSATNRTKVRLYDGTTAFNEAEFWGESADDYLPWVGMVKKTALTGAQTRTIDYSAVANTAKIRNACLIALRLDTMDNNYYDEDRTRATGTNDTWADRMTLTQTTLATTHVVIGTCILDGTSTTLSGEVQLLEDATSLAVQTQESGSSGFDRVYFVVKRASLTAAAHTWKFQTQSEAATNTHGIDEQVIAVLQTGTVAGSAPAVTNNCYRSLLGVGK